MFVLLHQVYTSNSLPEPVLSEPYLTKGPAKRGHIVAATLLTRACSPNVDSFCHVDNICGGHTKKGFLKIFRNVSCVRAARNNVAAFCQERATSQYTMLPPQCVLDLQGLHTGLVEYPSSRTRCFRWTLNETSWRVYVRGSLILRTRMAENVHWIQEQTGDFSFSHFSFPRPAGWGEVPRSVSQVPRAVQRLYNGLVQPLAQRCPDRRRVALPVLVWDHVYKRN